MKRGYERRIHMQQELNYEAWRQARFIAFTAVRPHLKDQNMTITQFMTLPGDDQIVKAQEQEIEDVYKFYIEKGWLKPKGKA